MWVVLGEDHCTKSADDYSPNWQPDWSLKKDQRQNHSAKPLPHSWTLQTVRWEAFCFLGLISWSRQVFRGGFLFAFVATTNTAVLSCYYWCILWHLPFSCIWSSPLHSVFSTQLLFRLSSTFVMSQLYSSQAWTFFFLVEVRTLNMRSTLLPPF